MRTSTVLQDKPRDTKYMNCNIPPNDYVPESCFGIRAISQWRTIPLTCSNCYEMHPT